MSADLGGRTHYMGKLQNQEEFTEDTGHPESSLAVHCTILPLCEHFMKSLEANHHNFLMIMVR